MAYKLSEPNNNINYGSNLGAEGRTKVCRRCKSEIPIMARVCPVCGKKQTGIELKYVGIGIIVFMIFLSIIGGNDDTEEEEKTSRDQTDTNIEESVESAYNFKEQAKEVLGDEKSDYLIRILEDEIGFDDLSSIEKEEYTLNYAITANGYEIMATEIDDNDFRVFIPSSEYVFYENNSVIMTFDDFLSRQITWEQRNTYYAMAKEIVESNLKNPGSADFPSVITESHEIAMQKNGEIVAVQSYVEAENSFGAKLKSDWTVQFVVIDENTYDYDIIYVKIGDEKSGEFIDMN